MNREKNLPNCFKCPTGVFHGEGSGWILHTHLVRLQFLGTRPSSVYFLSLFYCVEGSLDQGTVDITLFGCVPGDEPCRSEAITFREVNERGAPGVMVRELGGKYFQLKGWGVWTLLLAVWGWWGKPHSYIWQFRAPDSLGSEAVVWLFFLKGGIRPASC